MRNGLLPILLAALVTAPVAAFAQTAAAAGGLTFDVASVRPAAPIDRATMLATLQSGKRPESMRVDGLRATYTYMSLKELIANGYKVRAYEVDGPDWMVTDRFDIVAKLPAGAAKDDAPAMLQALLEERFRAGGPPGDAGPAGAGAGGWQGRAEAESGRRRHARAAGSSGSAEGRRDDEWTPSTGRCS